VTIKKKTTITKEEFKNHIYKMKNDFGIDLFDALVDYQFRHKLSNQSMAELVKGNMKKELEKELIKKRLLVTDNDDNNNSI
jgi:hypothetical protein